MLPLMQLKDNSVCEKIPLAMDIASSEPLTYNITCRKVVVIATGGMLPPEFCDKKRIR